MAAEPYVGPRPYESTDSGLFFGRDRETADLVSLIFAHAAVLLYAQSGAGKTSLLQAHLLPRLREKGFEVLPVRIRVLGSTFGDPAGNGNPYVVNVLRSCEGDATRPPPGFSIRQFFQARPHRLDSRSEPMPRVLVFDQFEEVFTSGPWQARREFFDQLGEALDAEPLLRVLFALREEYLAHLDPYARPMPERLRCRFRLELLRRPAALKAVEGPLKSFDLQFAEGVADALVRNMMKERGQNESGAWVETEGEVVEPVQLQVVCQSLWRDLPQGTSEITYDHLRDFGDVDQALIGFYVRCLQDAVQKTGFQEGRLRWWFERELITPSGTRGMVQRDEDETGGIPNRVVEALEDLHLVRGEWRAGSCWYELPHDRFIEPIRESNRRWREQLLGIAEQARRRLEEQARQWDGRGRGQEGLLAKAELREAELCLAAAGPGEIGASEPLLALVDHSRSRLEKVRLQRRFQIASLCVLLLVVLLTASGIWIWRSAQAQRLDFARQLSQVARTSAPTHPQRALLLASQAARIAGERSPEVLSTLYEVLSSSRGRPVASLGESPAGFAISADGRWLATAGAGGTLHLRAFDRRGMGSPPVVLQGMPQRISSVAVSPDGRWVAASGVDSAFVWDLKEGGTPKVLDVDGKPLERPVLARGGGWLLDLPPYESPRLWRLTDPVHGPKLDLRCEKGLVARTGLAPDLGRAAVACENGTVKTWRLSAQGPEREPEARQFGEPGRVSVLAVGREGTATAGPGRSVWFQELAAGERSTLLPEGVAEVSLLAFAPGRRLVIGLSSGAPLLWDLSVPGAGPRVLPVMGNEIRVAALSPDGLRLLVVEKSGGLAVWGIPGAEVVVPIRLRDRGGDLERARFSADGTWLFTEVKGEGARLWQLSTPDPRAPTEPTFFAGHRGSIHSLALSPDQRWLATSGEDGTMRLWDLRARGVAPLGRIVPRERSAPKPADEEPIAVSPRGDWRLTDSADQVPRLWDLSGSGPQRVKRLVGAEEGLKAATFSPGGHFLATGDGDGQIRLWDLEAIRARDQGPAEPFRSYFHDDAVTVFAFSPDDRWLAAGSLDQSVSLWNLSPSDHLEDVPARPQRLYGHEGAITALAVSRDGRLAAGSEEGVVRLWQLSERGAAEAATLAAGRGRIRALLFDPGRTSRWLVTAGEDGIARRWSLQTDELLDLACRLAGRELSAEETERFFGGDQPAATCPPLPEP